MTFAHVGSTLSWDASSGILLTPNGVGNLIVLCEVTKLAQTPMLTNISSSNVTWSRLTPDFDTSVASTPTAAAIWIGTVTSTSQAGVTLTWTGGGSEPAHWEAEVNEFSSTVGSWALDTYAGIDANGGNHAYPSLTPAGADELYVGIHYDDSGASAGSTSGYTYHVTSHGNGALYNADCTSSTQSPTWAGTEVMGGIAALIKEGSSSVTGTGAVTFKKMTAAVSGTPKIFGTGAIVLKKMSVSGSGNAGIYIIQQKGNTAQGSSVTVTLDNATRAGTTLVALIGDSADSSNGTPSTVTLGGSADNWQQVAIEGTSGDHAIVAGWIDSGNAGGSTDVDVTLTGGASHNLFAYVFEVANLPSAVLDVSTGSANSFSGTWTSGATGTTAQAREIAFGVTAGASNTRPPGESGPSSPWVNDVQQVLNGSSHDKFMLVGYQVLSATGAQTYSGTSSPTSTNDTLVFTLKSSSTVVGTGAVTLKKMTASVSGSVKVTGTAAVTLKKMDVVGTGPGGAVLQTLFGQPATGSTVSDDFTAYTMAMEFSLFQDAPLSGIWFYSPSGATTLPAGCAILNLDTSAVVSGTENDSPSWSGAAGSGWVRCAYDRSVTLATGTKYAVAIYKDTTEFVYSATAHYWDTTGDGASGLTSGIISAPNNAGSVHGQDSFFAGGSTFTVPDSSFNASNYWVDVEVVVVSSSVSGSGAVILKKMTSSGSGIVIVTGSGDVTLKKMTASGSGHAPLLGTGTVTLKKMIVSGSGSDKVIGVGAITMYKMVVHGTNIPIPKASSLFIFSLR